MMIKMFLYNIFRFLGKIGVVKLIVIIDKIYRFIYSAIFSSCFRGSNKNTIIGLNSKIYGSKYIFLGNNVRLGDRGILTAWSKVHNNYYNPAINIGDNVSIGEDYHITAINSITIEKNVLIGKKVTITDNSHGDVEIIDNNIPQCKKILKSKGPVVIERNVWIGEKCTILPNVTIGENSVIGANSVVTKNISKNSIAVGIPAKEIRKLNED